MTGHERDASVHRRSSGCFFVDSCQLAIGDRAGRLCGFGDISASSAHPISGILAIHDRIAAAAR
jgi:hypothetical protein